MTSNHHGPYDLGYTRATMVTTNSFEVVTQRQSEKSHLNSDCGLKLAHMKSELLVIPDQHAGVNAFPGLVHTARQATRVGSTQSRSR